jgi:hypothetical protein
MNEPPDMRWAGVSHTTIVEWTKMGGGTAVTEELEAHLKDTVVVLNDIADKMQTLLQQVNGGEWTGSAAAVAAQVMQVLRDFNDVTGHHGEMNALAVYGQSDNASWAKTNVPPVVEVQLPQFPTGTPIDILNSTVDYHHQVLAAKDAEEQARQVMYDYETMTTGRIAAFPPLPLPPPVAVESGIETTWNRADSGDGPRREHVAPPGGELDGSAPGPGERAGGPSVPPDSNGPSDNGSRNSVPSATGPTVAAGAAPPLVSSRGDELGRTFPSPAGGLGAIVAGPRTDGGPGSPRGGAQPVGLRGGDPGARGAQPGPGARGGVVEGRPGRHGSPAGVTPVGTTGPGRSGEDEEHQVKYGVPGSEIFEPDNEDGLLRDPFRPGSFVAPATIGDDDDE